MGGRQLKAKGRGYTGGAAAGRGMRMSDVSGPGRSCPWAWRVASRPVRVPRAPVRCVWRAVDRGATVVVLVEVDCAVVRSKVQIRFSIVVSRLHPHASDLSRAERKGR